MSFIITIFYNAFLFLSYLDFSIRYVDVLFLFFFSIVFIPSYFHIPSVQSSSLFFFYRAKRYTVHFFILNFLALILFRFCILLHTFLVCDTIFLLHSILPLRGAPSTAIHAIFFSLSSFLFLSSHCGEDCRAISVGSDVTWKMYYPRTLDRIICIRGVCISTAAYTGTVYTR